jgi:hypothetical protein
MTLFTDLQNAGLPVVSATDIPGKPRQATFSRTLTTEEEEIYLDLLFPFRQIQKARKANAINEVAAATQLKSVTPAQAVLYIENNVLDLPSAKVVLKIMVRMLIALRDETWPELPEK